LFEEIKQYKQERQLLNIFEELLLTYILDESDNKDELVNVGEDYLHVNLIFDDI
jgi:hypothetical protein